MPSDDFAVAEQSAWENDGPRLGTRLWQWAKSFAARHDRILPAAASVLLVFAILGVWRLVDPAPRPMNQHDIDNAVKFSLAHTPPGPADAAVAAAEIAPSVVRVDGYLTPEHAAQIAREEADADRKSGYKSLDKPVPMQSPASGVEQRPATTGSGVVINEDGDILTNLHVIHSTDYWMITFADGSVSEAKLISVRTQDDLAVIKAKKTPDEIKPATLASSRDLNPGDTVVAVGFPFGIGPSVSSGVVAGLNRDFVDPDQDPHDMNGGHLSNLIQFTAAVNPGNSGGPLVNRDGEVVGIVTAIYNPSGARVFAGMAFAVPIDNAAKAAGDNPF